MLRGARHPPGNSASSPLPRAGVPKGALAGEAPPEASVSVRIHLISCPGLCRSQEEGDPGSEDMI